MDAHAGEIFGGLSGVNAGGDTNDGVLLKYALQTTGKSFLVCDEASLPVGNMTLLLVDLFRVLYTFFLWQ